MVHIYESAAAQKIGTELLCFLRAAGYSYDRDLVVLCIGTDRSTGDSLGPFVGTRLTHMARRRFHVYGTLDKPVHADNFQKHLERIYRLHHQPFIIAVDASFGRLENIGYIKVKPGPLNPGSGVNKKLPKVGDIQIIGIISEHNIFRHLTLHTVRLNMVVKMAGIIAKGISRALENDFTDASDMVACAVESESAYNGTNR